MTRSSDDRDDRLHEELAAWDPARRHGDPPADLLARVRESLAGEPAALPAFLSPARLGWALAGLIALTALFAWQSMPETWSPRAPAAELRETVRLQLRSSNGTRIFWTIEPASHGDADPRREP